FDFLSWCRLRPPRRSPRRPLRAALPPGVEWLEDRSLLSGSPLAGGGGTLLTPDKSDSFSFTVASTPGSGRLTAEVAATGGTLVPRLTLSGPSGQVLIQSDSGRILQHLQPGTYSLTVSAQAGVGTYRLSTDFTQATLPFEGLAVGTLPRSV